MNLNFETPEERFRSLYRAYEDAECISCQPNNTKFPKIKTGTIIDENQTVVWNRQYVEESQKRRAEEVNRLNKIKNQEICKVQRQIFLYIMDTIGHNLTEEKARIIWQKAWDDGHSAGIAEVFGYLKDYINFAQGILD